MSVHGIGIDIADVARFRRLLSRGVLERWLTAGEQGLIDGATDHAQTAAAVFAAKEAAWKSLALDDWDDRVPWTWLGLEPFHSEPRGRMLLTGPVAAHASPDVVIDVRWCTTARVATALAICSAPRARAQRLRPSDP